MMTHHQATGLLHAPQRHVRELAAWGLALHDRIEDCERRLRAAQEGQAAEQLARTDYILVVLHRDGYVEVWAREWRPVRIAHLPELADEAEAEAWMLARLPAYYADLIRTDAGRRIATGHAKGCLGKSEHELLQRRLADIQAVKEFCERQRAMATLADGMETADATEAKAQSASVSTRVPDTAAAT